MENIAKEGTVQNEKKSKVRIGSWISLVIMLLMLSGVFTNSEGPLKVLDISNLTGSFGLIGESGNFIGKGGTSARDGFMAGLNLVPGIMLFSGLLGIFEHFGVYGAANIIFKPILRPLLGIPGSAGIAFTSSFSSSDIGAVLTREMYEKGELTEDERTIFTSYQYAGSAVIGNTVQTGAAMLPVTVLPVGIILVVEILCKLIGANIMRLAVFLKSRKKEVK